MDGKLRVLRIDLDGQWLWQTHDMSNNNTTTQQHNKNIHICLSQDTAVLPAWGKIECMQRQPYFITFFLRNQRQLRLLVTNEAINDQMLKHLAV